MYSNYDGADFNTMFSVDSGDDEEIDYFVPSAQYEQLHTRTRTKSFHKNDEEMRFFDTLKVFADPYSPEFDTKSTDSDATDVETWEGFTTDLNSSFSDYFSDSSRLSSVTDSEKNSSSDHLGNLREVFANYDRKSRPRSFSKCTLIKWRPCLSPFTEPEEST